MQLTDHKEAFQISCYTRKNSNLSRCYLELHNLLNLVWHCMNDKDPPSFPMGRIEDVLRPEEDKEC